jgi:hypothetical protein
MKCLFFLFAQIFFLSASQGQMSSLSPEIIKPSEILTPHSLSYRSIKVVDARFDTTKIGYLKAGNHYKKIVTEGPLSLVIENHLNSQLKKQLDKSANQNLLIIIKKLWLQQTNADELNNKKISTTWGATHNGFGMCTSVFDVYLQKESIYIPLIKVDTSSFTLKQLNKDAGYLLAFALENCINAVSSIELDKIRNRSTLLWKDIEQYNNKRLTYPRYTNDLLVQGIFLTFKDFLNNKPTVKKFVVQSGGITDELYVEQNGEAVLLEKFWGFCDGQKNYIHMGLNFFEITREANTYELWGSKIITEKSKQNNGARSLFSGLGVQVNPGITKKNKLNYEPLQLDMDTGKVY